MAIETSARIAFLKKIHLFYGLEEDDYERIANELEEIQIPKGGVVFEQGAKADSFYLIYGGSVRIVRKQNNKEFQLAILVKNDYFGEMALVEHRLRSGTVTALTDTLLLVLSRKDFEDLYKSDPQLKINLEIAIKSRQLARSLRYKWLRDDEVVYFLARKHRLILYQKLIWPLLALFVPSVFFYAWYFIIGFAIVGLAAWLSLIAIVLWAVWLIIDWGNDYYIVTNQRVVWLEKVVGIYDSRMESPISTVLSVGVEANQFGRLLDYGNVIVRTFVGKITFSNVDHPEQAARMIEEYWQRTREAAVGMEKEAMKNAIRKRLGIPVPTPAKPKTDSERPAAPPLKRERLSLLRLLGADTLKLRYETGDTVIYRKHWLVLIMQAWMPVAGTLAVILLLISRLVQLAFNPNEVFISFQGGMAVDAWAGALFLALFPLAGWLAYEVADWSNDKFEVTAEQIIDLDKKPFGTETRNAAQLDSILGTEYKRIGILGNLFNYGTVYITVGGSKFAFEDVIDPPAVQSDIDRRRMARMAKKNDATVAAERERMAEWLATYHHSAAEFQKEVEKKSDQKSE
ncbi:MAG: cyclic nucleotide-binding domain-containing protein [Anaerolineae bacterium]|nr:cyclic nucleotide-binding domain-containing protein [Anaerolineae bacterium]MCI0608024.1 cyclic nucleotide-binding domain-containing protein [Anaerolineae bacterium]